MVEESLLGLMGPSIKENIKLVRLMEVVHYFILMGISMKENGRMGKKMVTEDLLCLMEQCT